MRETKRTRLADFASRAAYAPEDVQSLPGLGRFIAVHPMADESAVLARLGISPQDCDKVDLYWEYADDVRFVEFCGVDYGTPGELPPVGMFARLTRRGSMTILVCLLDATITSTLVETVLQELVRILGETPNLRLTGEWSLLGDSHLFGLRR